jgi:hypothetical protein
VVCLVLVRLSCQSFRIYPTLAHPNEVFHLIRKRLERRLKAFQCNANVDRVGGDALFKAVSLDKELVP